MDPPLWRECKTGGERTYGWSEFCPTHRKVTARGHLRKPTKKRGQVKDWKKKGKRKDRKRQNALSEKWKMDREFERIVRDHAGD